MADIYTDQARVLGSAVVICGNLIVTAKHVLDGLASTVQAEDSYRNRSPSLSVPTVAGTSVHNLGYRRGSIGPNIGPCSVAISHKPRTEPSRDTDYMAAAACKSVCARDWRADRCVRLQKFIGRRVSETGRRDSHRVERSANDQRWRRERDLRMASRRVAAISLLPG